MGMSALERLSHLHRTDVHTLDRPSCMPFGYGPFLLRHGVQGKFANFC